MSYRYRLTRNVAEGELFPRRQRTMLMVMCNPSTADDTVDDPTIRRCIGFAEREGCTRLEVVNLFAWRATDPRDLATAMRAGEDIVGPDNPHVWHQAIEELNPFMDLAIAAWGAVAEPWSDLWSLANLLGDRFCHVAKEKGIRMWSLGRTVNGSPRHPLMLPADAPLERWWAS